MGDFWFLMAWMWFHVKAIVPCRWLPNQCPECDHTLTHWMSKRLLKVQVGEDDFQPQLTIKMLRVQPKTPRVCSPKLRFLVVSTLQHFLIMTHLPFPKISWMLPKHYQPSIVKQHTEDSSIVLALIMCDWPTWEQLTVSNLKFLLHHGNKCRRRTSTSKLQQDIQVLQVHSHADEVIGCTVHFLFQDCFPLMPN